MQKLTDRWTQYCSRRIWRPVALGGALAVAAAGWLPSHSWGDEEAEAAPGLRGILAEEVPDGLTFDEFEQLDGNWAEWAEGVATELETFYEGEDVDEARQREILATLNKKLETMQKALDDSRYASLHGPIRVIRARLQQEVSLAEAILDSLHLDPEVVRASQVDAAQAELKSAVSTARGDLTSVKGGRAWLPYFKADELKSIAAGDGISEEQAGTLATVVGNLTRMEGLNDEQKEFLSRDSLSELAAAAQSLHDAATRDLSPGDMNAIRAEMGVLAQALADYRSDSSITNATAARESYRKLSGMLMDGGDRVGAALRANFFNFNVHVVASEKFLNKFVGQSRNESGPVVDFILGAQVRGNQSTDANVSLDLKNSRNGARMDITLSGVTRSRTSGTTPEAVIFTSGYHRFRASKELRFNGDRFDVSPARISVQANNTTTGARTGFSDVPLFGGIADNIAVGEARKRKGQSEAIAASRVTDRVVPEFNKEVDSEFATVNSKLEDDLNSRLKDRGLFPSARQIWSTEKQFTLSARLMGDLDLGANRPHRRYVKDGELLVQLHETAANNALETMALAGETLTEDELAKRIQDNLSDLLGRPISLDEEKDEAYDEPAEDDGTTTLIFDEHDPIRVQFREGSVILKIRAALKQEGKDDIPAQKVDVPIEMKVEGDVLKLSAGRVRVSPMEKPKSLQTQIARAGVIRKKIQRATPDREVDTLIEVEEEGKPTVEMKLTSVTSEGGWLSLSFE